MQAGGRLLRFQFLIGTLETQGCHLGADVMGAVSIPHRYARNQGGLAPCFYEFLFQFLIGTLETRRTEILQYSFFMFQFLIGTLETPDGFILYSAVLRFNSS